MSKYNTTSTINLPPTDCQVSTVSLMCQTLGITWPLDEDMRNRMEARGIMRELQLEITRRRLWWKYSQLKQQRQLKVK